VFLVGRPEADNPSRSVVAVRPLHRATPSKWDPQSSTLTNSLPVARSCVSIAFPLLQCVFWHSRYATPPRCKEGESCGYRNWRIARGRTVPKRRKRRLAGLRRSSSTGLAEPGEDMQAGGVCRSCRTSRRISRAGTARGGASRSRRIRLASPFLLRTTIPAAFAGRRENCARVAAGGKAHSDRFGSDIWLVLHLMIAGRLHWKPAPASLRVARIGGFRFPAELAHAH